MGGGNLKSGHERLREFVKLRAANVKRLKEAAGTCEGMTMDSSNVRLAQPGNRAKIIELTKELHGENGLFSMSDKKVRAMLDRFYNREGAVIGVIGPVGDPVATIYLGIDQMSYSDDWALVEQWNFCSPRASQIQLRLGS